MSKGWKEFFKFLLTGYVIELIGICLLGGLYGYLKYESKIGVAVLTFIIGSVIALILGYEFSSHD